MNICQKKLKTRNDMSSSVHGMKNLQIISTVKFFLQNNMLTILYYAILLASFVTGPSFSDESTF